METVQRFGWLLMQVLNGLTYSAWVSATVLIVVVLALFVRRPRHDQSFRRLLRFAALLLLLPMVLIFVAAVFANEDPYRAVSPVREQLVLAAFVLNVLLALTLVVVGRAQIWRAVAFSLANIWVGMWSAFIAVMSVTGNWL